MADLEELRAHLGSQLVEIEHEGHGGKDMGAALRRAYAHLLPVVRES